MLGAAITEFVSQKHEEYFGNDRQDGNPVSLGTKQTHSNEYFPNNRRLKLEMGTAERYEQHPAPNSSRARVTGSGSSRSQGPPTASRGCVDHSHFSFTTGSDSWTGNKKKMRPG